jgi:hypothetical protein
MAEEDFAFAQRDEVAVVQIEVRSKQGLIDCEAFVAQVAQDHSHGKRLKG